jgi:hypothetical protein
MITLMASVEEPKNAHVMIEQFQRMAHSIPVLA